MITVLKSGLQSSFQDKGRYHFRHQGVPLSGAMDLYAMELANHLVSNSEDTPVLEFTLMGPDLHFEKSCYIALTGALFSPILNGDSIPMHTRVYVEPNSTLKLGNAREGMYGYLAIQGGYELKEVLGSCSYYLSVAPHLKIEKGQQINYHSSNQKASNFSRVAPVTNHFDGNLLEVNKGPEFSSLSKTHREKLLSTKYTIGQSSNRMSIQLEHKESLSASEIITSPVQPGTIQLTPSGKLMALMRDAQTTGGYARVLQLTPEAIQRLAQKKMGSKVRFGLSGKR